MGDQVTVARGLVKDRDFSSATSPDDVTVEASCRSPNSKASWGEARTTATAKASPRLSSTVTLAAGRGTRPLLILRLVTESSVFSAPSIPASRFSVGLAVRRKWTRPTVSETSFSFRKRRLRVGLSNRA